MRQERRRVAAPLADVAGNQFSFNNLQSRSLARVTDHLQGTCNDFGSSGRPAVVQAIEKLHFSHSMT